MDEAQKTWFKFFLRKHSTVQCPVIADVERKKKNKNGTKTAVDI